MTAIRRVLKHLPLLAIVLLLLAWPLSVARRIGVISPAIDGALQFNFECRDSTLILGCREYLADGPQLMWRGSRQRESEWSDWLGVFLHYYDPAVFRTIVIAMPIPVVITLLIPIAIGSYNSFRFRLWHFLAYTGLLGLELAYYLRWAT